MIRRNAQAAVARASLATLAVASGADADQCPPRKPGLWQMTVTMQGSPVPPMTSKYCIDAATESALISAGQNAANKMCSGETIRITGGTGTIDATCKFGNMTSTSHTVITFMGDAAYHSETRSHLSPPPKYVKSDHVTVNDAKWTGPCPAGMKPGDIVMGNGMRMHLDPNAMQMQTPRSKSQ